MQKLDLTGMQIGSWDVKEYAGNKKWLCQCRQCGTLKEVATYSLTSGKSTSCGKCGSKLDYDLTNKVFGNLKALLYTGIDNKWVCLCTCGRLTEKYSKNLRYERTTVCGREHGCQLSSNDTRNNNDIIQRYPKLKNISMKDWTSTQQTNNTKMLPATRTPDESLTGAAKMLHMKVGDLEVIEQVIGVKDRWVCRCKCGEMEEIRGYSLRHPKSKNSYKCRHAKKTSTTITPEVSALNNFKTALSSMYLQGQTIYEKQINQFNYEYRIGTSNKIVINFELTESNKCIKQTDKQNKTLTYANAGIQYIQIYQHEWEDENTRRKLIQCH